MITRRNEKEIELLRQAGKIVAMTHEYLKPYVKAGISTKELDEMAEKFIRSQGAIPSFKGYGGFPGSICASINDVLVHGIPNAAHILKDGDIISIDIGANYKGYHGDSAWTYAVGEVSEEAKELMRVTEESLYRGLDQVKPGNRISDISNAIQTFVEAHGYGVPRDYTGHGIGTNLHEDPIVPNYGKNNSGVVLQEGMTLAIEPMSTLGKRDVYLEDNDWTVTTQDGLASAHYENTVLITKDGVEILTL